MQTWYRNPLLSRDGLRIGSCILQRKHTVHSVYMIFRFFAVSQERWLLQRPLRCHNLPMLVGKGPRQAGTHAIRELCEAQVALTYAVLVH